MNNSVMDKSCQQSSADSTTTTDTNNYLRHLNKLSHKISKPPILNNINKTSFDPLPQQQLQNFNNNNNPLQHQQNPQHQPPVYNINKNDFRDVVQKLTGAPANDRISSSSAPAPLSPLPPFPTVHAAAESPISAYMRDLQSFKGFSGFSPLPLPPVPSLSQPENQQQQQQQEQENQPPPPQQEVVHPTPVAQSQSPFQMPSSPGPFGCLNSQLASYPLLSPGLLFSPNSGNLGFPQLPLSPTVPLHSPRWKEI
ncbi:hypothetical protein P8452_28551 [Trifolium repens]|nr:hypothetical protein P8452_28551 [Trifolium repens]